MKRVVYFLIVILFFGLNACDNDEHYSLGDMWLSMGFINMPNSGDIAFYIVTDNCDTLLPLANNVPYFEIEDRQRVIVNYSILDDADTLGNKFWVKINNLQEVLYKEIIDLSIENTIDMGNDPINIEDAWLSKKILNFELGFYGGEKTHMVNLVYDFNELSDSDSPVELELRHNALNDSLPYYLKAIVSFDLSVLTQNRSDSINFRINYTNLKNEEKTLRGTINN